MDLRNWEFFDNGNPVVGANVYVRDAILTHPNAGTIVASGVVDSNGAWAFTGLTDTAKDVEVVWGNVGQYHKWYKGMTRHSVGAIFYDDPLRFKQIATPSAPGAGASLLYFKSDGQLYRRSGTGAEVQIADLVTVPAVRAYHSATQAIANATWTSVALNSERFDTDTMHDTVTSNNLLIAKTAGIYVITGNVRFASNATGMRALRFIFNSSTQIGITFVPANGSTDVFMISAATIYQFAVNNWVEMQVYQTSGGSLNLDADPNSSPEFAMARVG